MAISRRDLFLAGGAALVSRRSLGAADSGSGMITISPSPKDLETPVGDFVNVITPTEHFFVRCHTMTPEVKLADWKLEVTGLVDRPGSLTMADLKKLPRVSMQAVLECAGNGRSFYQPRMPGAQWKFGSVGNAVWTGVRLRDVLAKFNLKSGGKHLLFDGADVPIGKMQDFQRTIPVEKGLDPDTILAYEMNGKPLTAEHGFPLRVVAPGWASDSWVKWLRKIDVLDHEFDGFWMKTAYRHPAQHVAPGTAVDPKDMVPVTDLNVKSLIATPNEWAAPGTVTIKGVAWSNASPVTKVDVSVDGGKTWNAAKLGAKPTKYGFRAFNHVWKAPEGSHVLMARATNAAGQVQPVEPEWNPNGYLYNAAQPRPITVSKSPQALASVSDPSTASAPGVYKAACTGCHDDHFVSQQRLTRAQWDREVTKMTGWGAEVKAEDRGALLDYLAATFKP